MVTWARFLQPANASGPIFVTVFGIVISVRSSQSAKAPYPMEVTPEPKSTVLMPQRAKACCPIFVTEFGIRMLVKLLQSANARLPMEVTPDPRSTVLSPAACESVFTYLGNGVWNGNVHKVFAV